MTNKDNKPSIAFLGTGLMGLPMCRCLLKGGFELTVWNRSIEKAEGLKNEGANRAVSPAEAVKRVDVVITMLSDGTAVEEVLFEGGMAEGVREGVTHIDMSSIGADEGRSL